MLKKFLTRVDNKIAFTLSKFVNSAIYAGEVPTALIVGLNAWLLSIFLYAPPLFMLRYGEGSRGRWHDLLAMCANPLTRDLQEPILAYRITLPLIAHSLGLYGEPWSLRAMLASPGLPYLALVLTLAVIYFVVQRQTNPTIALLTTLALALTQVTQWTNTHWGHPDSLTHLFVALAMLSPSFCLVAPMAILGSLNDERFILAIFFVLVWFYMVEPIPMRRKRLLMATFGFVCGLAVVLLIRYALTVGWIGDGINRPSVYSSILNVLINPLKTDWGVFGTSLFLGYRWVWILPGLALVFSFRGLDRWIRIWIGFGLIAASYSTLTVADISRSTAFYFPAIIVSVLFLYRQAPLLCYRALIGTSIACALTPGLYLFGFDDVQLYRPLPLVLIRWFTGWDILNLFR